ncbi:MAG: hypothetical protein K1X72_23610 [Pyrinomonadaceae bacterium]|nr:hypothetical protein [Pyrinomonadaceae bacterium]
MAYSSFSALDLKNKFGVDQEFVDGIFTQIKPHKASDLLLANLKQNLNFALNQSTEKARSEFIIAPVFAELFVQGHGKVSIFSGVEFNVDRKLGLIGWCDFLVSRSSFQRELEAPVVIAVEAKQDDFKKGISQCIAEMIAARIFNEKNGKPIAKIYGCVTTGDVWRFLVLEDNLAKIETVSFDVREDIERILGILYSMALGETEG